MSMDSQTTNSSPIENLITEHIDIWSSAIKRKSSSGRGSSKKIELYGIKKLRELILELAVRGKLVPQDPNDEPASVLLERIAQEKDQLVKDGKIKNPKKLPEISEDEKPFELPEGWEWVRLGAVYSLEYGDNLPKTKRDENGVVPVYGSNGVVGHHTSYCVTAPCIVIGRKGSAGALNLCLDPECWVTDVAYSVIPPCDISLRFAFIQHHTFGLNELGKGIKPGLNRNEAYPIVIAIPPAQEQLRIVVKVDELMALCDHLEAQTESSLDAHQTLVTVLLDTLVNSQNAEELTENWTRISGHFDTLFTTEQSIDQLKQTILQLAVMGKLVEQNPNDEPASVLLERIAAEKADLIKQGKIKKQKPLSLITEEEKPFELPKEWEWERVGTFGVVGTGATPSRSNPVYWEPAEINWVSSGETSELFLGKTKEQVSKIAIKETNVSIYPVGTLIVAMYGQGKTRGQITELLEPAGTNQACAAIRLLANNVEHKNFVKLFFRKAYLELREHAAGGAQPNLNVGKIANTVVPLPPLEEQHRIVTKVDELMAICDQLKARLSEAQTTQLNLADALVKEAL